MIIKRIKDFMRKRKDVTKGIDVTKGMQEPPQDSEIKWEHLPINMSPSREEFEKLGFCFYKWTYKGAGEKWGEVATDQVLCLAKLPEGWSIKGFTNLYSEILDENGTTRVSVFFKNEPWDRRGTMLLRNL
ncbi:MAG: hypothetical protein HFJ19_04670 [Clostridia bacterium]|nr:hypothetical protein [Clostridia bacterium]